MVTGQREPAKQKGGIVYDAIIIGARCAGSPTAMLLARKGYRVLLVDKVTFPSDTISTHYLHQISIARLQRWGLVNKVLAPIVHRFASLFLISAPLR
jgi:flavin-dependent dehydrogenase